MNINKVREVISSAFSAAGFTKDSYSVRLESPTSLKLYGDSNSLHVIFDEGTLPVVSVKKIVKLSVYLEEIYIDARGGKIKLRHFPDINFKFDDAEEDERVAVFTCEANLHAGPAEVCHDLLSELDDKYGSDPKRRKIARKVLQYAEVWAIMNAEGGTNFYGMDKHAALDAKNHCIDFVKQQMRKDDSTHGSILVVLLVQLILPYIIKWAVEKMLDRLING